MVTIFHLHPCWIFAKYPSICREIGPYRQGKFKLKYLVIFCFLQFIYKTGKDKRADYNDGNILNMGSHLLILIRLVFFV